MQTLAFYERESTSPGYDIDDWSFDGKVRNLYRKWIKEVKNSKQLNTTVHPK
jgi:hypothetical protein